jgi:uncharacterized protein (DUF4415 family)/uncharacterized DUF497 family protein
MNWDWDKSKDHANLRKHGLSFAAAQLVFDDPLALSRIDDFVDEERWQTVGRIGSVTVLVVHTAPQDAALMVVLSVHGKPQRMKGELMKKEHFKPLPAKQRAELKAITAKPDDQIDISDVPEVLDWSGAKRSVFYRPIKQQLTLRLDADVVDWFKQQGEGYQSRINAALRAHVGRKAG